MAILIPLTVHAWTMQDALKVSVVSPAPLESVALVAPTPVLKPEPQTVEEMVRREFADAPVMVDIARAESRFNPEAKNPHSTATGVFQILIGTWKGAGCTGERTNAADNIRCARKIYNDSGTTPWLASSHNW